MEFLKAKSLYRLLLPIIAGILTTIVAVAAVSNDASTGSGPATDVTDAVLATEVTDPTEPEETIGEVLPGFTIPEKPEPEPEEPTEPEVQYSTIEKINDFILARLDTWSCPIRADYEPITGLNAFGSIRNGGSRTHAAIDFVAPHGTAVYAVTSGTVQDISLFYEGTLAVEILNDDGSVLRYCEIATHLHVGDKVKQGEKVGTIKRAYSGTAMLHIELYYGDEQGSLTQPWNCYYKYVKNRGYNRRSDLIDPTFLKDLDTYILPLDSSDQSSDDAADALQK